MKYHQNNSKIKKQYKDLEKNLDKKYDSEKVLFFILKEQKDLFKESEKIIKRIDRCNEIMMSGVQGLKYKNAMLRKDKLYQELRPITSQLEVIEYVLTCSKSK